MLKRQKLDYPEPAIFSWDYRIFADDWPVLMMWSALSNNENCTHRYHWVDPDVHKQDLEFINDQIYQLA
jgi:hypothetical protein